MTQEMQAFIAGAERLGVHRRCREITALMASLFPELRRVRGYYYDPDGERHPHWWLAFADGRIVDPTIAQFERGGHYVEFTGPEPLGQCYNCGDLVFFEAYNTSPMACSKDCFDAICEDFPRATPRRG